ncbi:unnamed protein product [Gongylonema pulchrum]|uniref:NHL repeat-containing protein n=1 Tax=Gongylonema pulchrum TaxID=637853 RepID=A0A3P7RK08_9BILA|nr:unnamed protein product [Gongylonema pulchrum]
MVVLAFRGASDMKMYGVEGDSEGAFCRPQGITADNEGHVLVCDSRNNRIQVTFFSSKAITTTTVAAAAANVPSTSSSTATTSKSAQSVVPPAQQVTSAASAAAASTLFPILDRPTDLCVSPDGLIYVVDFGSSCVRVY